MNVHRNNTERKEETENGHFYHGGNGFAGPEDMHTPGEGAGSEALTAALYYYDHGCFVVPCCTMTAQGRCTFPHTHTTENSIGKVPLLGPGWQHARLTREEIIAWWTKHPTANVGVLLEPSGLLVIDLDSDAATEEATINGLPPGPQVRAGRGVHHYCRNPKNIIGVTVKRGASRGIDVLSKGIVVGFGSMHRFGKRYALLTSWEEWPLEDSPLWAEHLLLDSRTTQAEAEACPDDLPPIDLAALDLAPWLRAVIVQGQSPFSDRYPSRSEAVFAVACALVDAGCDTATIASILLDPRFAISAKPREQGARWTMGEIARARAKTATDEDATAGDAEDFADDGRDTDGAAYASAPTEGTTATRMVPLTDLGNGERLIARYGQDLLFNNLAKKFLIWDGQRWDVDNVQHVRQWARCTIRGLYEEVKHLTERVKNESGEKQKRTFARRAQMLLRHAVKSEAESRVNAMIHNCQMDVPILPEQLDTDLWALNVRNGTLDLHTGFLRPQRREDRITKMIPIVYDPLAQCPTWDTFLYEVMAHQEDDVEFLRKAVGYSLTGDCREDCLFLLYGMGRNGKTTFLEVVREVLGDYATTAAFSTFLHTATDSVRNDVADLRSARFVSAIEADKDKKLSEALIKRLTGRDMVKARFLFQEFFEFKPQLKLWLGTNHKPVIQGTDDGIWQRIRLVPFTVKFEGKNDDKKLGEKLRAELPGILAWAVRGCLSWQAHGLPLPDTIAQATGEYRKEMDMLGSFLEEKCERKPHLRVRAGDLYNAYVSFSGDKFLTQTAFGRALNDRGIAREKTGGTVWRLGIALSTEEWSTGQ